jgi:SEC-C motif domain protein
MKCPCHSDKSYEECCERYHQGAAAENALKLMRSRYAAYALGLADYIMRTTYLEQRPADEKQWKKEILSFSEGTEFLGLHILEFIDGPKEAYVTFSALLEQRGHNASFTEKSHFMKSHGHWFYTQGKRIV